MKKCAVSFCQGGAHHYFCAHHEEMWVHSPEYGRVKHDIGQTHTHLADFARTLEKLYLLNLGEKHDLNH